ncbi:MAG TPA: hypothetical protein VNX23_11760 [Bradyrhizobium sp.]|uniref:hypothetical protein n=1 Tax=Bradyrhizobium sp. TaxID=376 RepID=UPI002C126127|nr:hypothetical protein [Bradyrhizobium sp.]HXB78058.1 hypothetical protein [Bradyrhizobium sp.]
MILATTDLVGIFARHRTVTKQRKVDSWLNRRELQHRNSRCQAQFFVAVPRAKRQGNDGVANAYSAGRHPQLTANFEPQQRPDPAALERAPRELYSQLIDCSVPPEVARGYF